MLATYWAFTRAGFRRHSTYVAATLSALFVNVVFAFLRSSLLVSALAVGSFGGYTAAMALTYAWWTQAIIGPFNFMSMTTTLGQRIRSGDVAVDLLRPVNVVGAHLATDFGRAAIDTLTRALPILGIATVLGQLTYPRLAATYPLLVLSLVLGVALNFLGLTFINLTTMFTLDNRGLPALYGGVMMVLSGFTVPVSWFPPWLKDLAHASPFPSMAQTTIDVATERLPTAELALAVLWQGIWAAVMWGLCAVVMQLGQRKLVLQGG